MSQNPINLAVRFFLEIAALLAIGYWATTLTTGFVRYLLAIACPLIAAAAWGVFRVPGDASASGNAPVPVPGLVRLIFELFLFGLAVWGLFSAGATTLATVLGAIAAAHYIISYDRIFWLLKR